MTAQTLTLNAPQRRQLRLVPGAEKMPQPPASDGHAEAIRRIDQEVKSIKDTLYKLTAKDTEHTVELSRLESRVDSISEATDALRRVVLEGSDETPALREQVRNIDARTERMDRSLEAFLEAANAHRRNVNLEAVRGVVKLIVAVIGGLLLAKFAPALS